MAQSPMSSPWLATPAVLAAATLGTAVVAAEHIWRTAQYGVICGLEHGGHCWACYASPMLGLATITAWLALAPRPATAPATAKARTRRDRA